MRLSSLILLALGGAALTAAVAVLPVAETTVFDEAISRSFTVSNQAGSKPVFDEAISRSFTVLNTAGTVPIFDEAISRAFTVVNQAGSKPVFDEAISRSFTVLNRAGSVPIFDEAISRAFTVCNAAGAGCECEGSPCDDGNACTVGETCQSGVCTGGAPPDCPAVPCNLASCDPNGTEDNCDILTPVPDGTPCGNPSDTPCDNPDTCDGFGSCAANLAPFGTLCREAAGQCDVTESCTGVDRDCPPDGLAPPGRPCGNPADSPCDHPDTCDAFGACRSNREPDGTPCDDGLFCTTGEACLGGACVGRAGPCRDAAHCDEAQDRCICLSDKECDDGHECTVDNCVNGECVHLPDPGCGVEAFLDIKPGSCPNPINVGAKGVVPVALVGTPSFDVSRVDVASLSLSRADGIGRPVAPLPRSALGVTFEDVATPFEGTGCECHSTAGDGTTDLSLKFSHVDMADALELWTVPDRTVLTLVVSGRLDNGAAFAATDCVRIQRNERKGAR